MTTNQIYTLLNSVNSQSEGKVGITVVDTASLVALGDTILSSSTNTEPFLNSLCQMIYKDIVEGRSYKSPLRDLMKGNAEWGAIVRKITVEMPELEEEVGTGLVDGQAVDMYKVNLPQVEQFLFVKRTPYVASVTIQRTWLKEAFRDESSMETFIASIFMKIQNRLELSIENLTKMSIANYIGLTKTSQTFNLVTMYNAEIGAESGDADFVAAGASALHNANFMRWAVGMIKELMSNLTSMSVLYNNKGKERFTPYSEQHVMMLSKFKTQLETVALYGAFNEEYVNLTKKEIIPHWQGSGTTPMTFAEQSKVNVKVSVEGTPTDKVLTNVVAVVFDNEAVGAYRKVEEVATTPLNAKGLYTNTFFHEQQLWFNALDENFVVFTLN